MLVPLLEQSMIPVSVLEQLQSEPRWISGFNFFSQPIMTQAEGRHQCIPLLFSPLLDFCDCPVWSMLMIHLNGGQWYAVDETLRERKRGGEGVDGEVRRWAPWRRGICWAYICSPLPSPNLTPLLRGFRWPFYHPPATTTWTPWLLIRARHCSGLGARARICACACVWRGGGLYSSQVFINATNIKYRWTMYKTIKKKRNEKEAAIDEKIDFYTL